MNLFRQLFPVSVNEACRNVPKVIGMIHALALPGTPSYKTSSGKRKESGMQIIIDQAKREAEIFAKFKGICRFCFDDYAFTY